MAASGSKPEERQVSITSPVSGASRSNRYRPGLVEFCLQGNIQAARELEIAPKTADNHIQSLYSKIGVSTRAGAALYALERGLVQ